MYYIEMTDTFAGEMNYSWVRRYKVKAKTLKAAMRKVSMHTGYNARRQWNMGGEEAVYKVVGACIAYSVTRRDDDENRREYYTHELIE